MHTVLVRIERSIKNITSGAATVTAVAFVVNGAAVTTTVVTFLLFINKDILKH